MAERELEEPFPEGTTQQDIDFYARQRENRESHEEEAVAIALSALAAIHAGAIEVAFGQISDPENPSLNEMVAGVGIYFRRLGAQRFEQIPRDIAGQVIPDIAEEELEEIGSRADEQADVDNPSFQEAIDDYVSRRTPIFRGPVRRNTRSNVTAAVEDAHGPEKELEQIRAEVEEQLRGQRQPRADTIGATEVAAATGLAVLAAGALYSQVTGTAMVKRWISMLDAKVRRPPTSRFNHWSPHGQTVPFGRPFQISGEELMFPGDPSMGASLGNLLACRCVPLPLPRSAVDESDILMT